MPHVKNKVRWCLKKAEDELRRTDTHRGIIKKKPNLRAARQHITKAEHNLRAVIAFKEVGFSDWSASAAFYAIYHALLAVLIKKGYESRNQECTFALIHSLIDAGELQLEASLIEQIHQMDPAAAHAEPTVVGLRELEQYGVSHSLDEHHYEWLLNLSRELLDQVKTIIEE